MRIHACFIAGLLAFPALTHADSITITDTRPIAVSFHVISNNYIDGRNLQLRKLDDGRQIVVVDAVSPILRCVLRNGALQFIDKNPRTGKLSTPGPLAFFKDIPTNTVTTLSEIHFKEASLETPVDIQFYLEDTSRHIEYDLWHNTTDTVEHHGWLACPIGAVWQLFYYTWDSKKPLRDLEVEMTPEWKEFDDALNEALRLHDWTCEFVGVKARLIDS